MTGRIALKALALALDELGLGTNGGVTSVALFVLARQFCCFDLCIYIYGAYTGRWHRMSLA